MTPERWWEVTQIHGAVLTRASERRAARLLLTMADRNVWPSWTERRPSVILLV
jgi:hypothetical protein